MPYSPDTRSGFRLAFAPDQNSAFEPDGGLILSHEDVGCRRIGLPFLWREGESWHLVSRRYRRMADSSFFGRDSDLRSWTADPTPCLIPRQSMGRIQSGNLCASDQWARVMLYNGASEVDQWDVGVATERKGRWCGSPRPVLGRTADEVWSGQRLEGLDYGKQRPNARALYFGTPVRSLRRWNDRVATATPE